MIVTPFAISRLISARGFPKIREAVGVSLFEARFVTIGTISDSVLSDGILQVMVQPKTMCGIVFALQCD